MTDEPPNVKIQMKKIKQAQREKRDQSIRDPVYDAFFFYDQVQTMSCKRVRELRALIEGNKGEIKSTVKPAIKKESKGTVLERIRAKEKLGEHVKRQQETTKKKIELAAKQIAEVEKRVREIIREQKACGAAAVSRRRLCVLVEDSFSGYMEPEAVARSVDRVLAEQAGTALNGRVPPVLATCLLKEKVSAKSGTES